MFAFDHHSQDRHFRPRTDTSSSHEENWVPVIEPTVDLNGLPSTLEEAEDDLYLKSLPHQRKESVLSLERPFISSLVPTINPPTPDDFLPLKVLGRGSFGKVLLVKQKATGRLFAQKQLAKSSLAINLSPGARGADVRVEEKEILESIRHPFIVQLYYAFQDKHKLYLILEYASGGELFTHLALEKMFPEQTVVFYTAQLFLALHHLHSLNIIYRDLKPENVLLSQRGDIILTDFGLSKQSAESSTFLGTVEYMAPEILTSDTYSFQVDYWSLGCVVFDMLTGSPPFHGSNRAKITENITRAKVSYPYYLSPDARAFLGRLLQKNPSKRSCPLTPSGVASFQKDRFFRKIEWKLLKARKADPPIAPLVTDPEAAENFADEFTKMAIKDDEAFIDVGLQFGGFTWQASHSLLNSLTPDLSV